MRKQSKFNRAFLLGLAVLAVTVGSVVANASCDLYDPHIMYDSQYEQFHSITAEAAKADADPYASLRGKWVSSVGEEPIVINENNEFVGPKGSGVLKQYSGNTYTLTFFHTFPKDKKNSDGGLYTCMVVFRHDADKSLVVQNLEKKPECDWGVMTAVEPGG